MKYLGIILGVVVLAFAGLFVVYRFATGSRSGPKPTAQQVQATGAAPKPGAPTNSTAQILQGSAAVIGAIGSLGGLFGGKSAEVTL